MEIEAQLREAFAVFDVSGDGQIDATELGTILEAVMDKKFSQEEIEQMINAVDEGGNGEIEMDEFLQLMNDQMSKQEQDEELIAAFKFFGAGDVDDVITFDSLRQSLKDNGDVISDADLRIIFDEISGASLKALTRQPTSP